MLQNLHNLHEIFKKNLDYKCNCSIISIKLKTEYNYREKFCVLDQSKHNNYYVNIHIKDNKTRKKLEPSILYFSNRKN